MINTNPISSLDYQPDFNQEFARKPVTYCLGRTFVWVRDQVSYLTIKTLAYVLFPLAARCVVFSSTKSFKKRCDMGRVERSREILRGLGGRELDLQMPDGHKVSAMYLDSNICLEVLIQKGAQKRRIQLSNDQVQDILYIPQEQGELRTLVERMHLPLQQGGGIDYIELGVPKINSTITDQTDPGIVIYAPGSGHIFEFRKKTIGTFLIGYGMNMLVFNYSGTGKSQGKISEQASYENVEAAYKYLSQDKGIPDHKIVGYGHCMGSGPILNLAAKYPITSLIDRSPMNMRDFAVQRAIAFCRLPFFLHFLTNWIPDVMEKCFCYPNDENIKKVRGHVALIQATQDEIIPEKSITKLFERSIEAKSRVKLTFDSNHDMDLCGNDKSLRLALGEFLTKSEIIGH